MSTMMGIAIAVIGLILGFVLDGGSVGSLIQPTAMLIVFGGTIGATLTTTSIRNFTSIGRYIMVAIKKKDPDYDSVITRIVSMATMARKEGILALEEQLESIEDKFMRDGLQLVVDGSDPSLVQESMEIGINSMEKRHSAVAKMFDAAGGFAPTMGIIGTVMGLVHVLGNLQNVSTLGPEIATAFIATLYGVSSANIFWLPIGSKLKSINVQEVILKDMIIEGVLSIQAGENPKIIESKLRAYVPATTSKQKGSTEALKNGEAAVNA